MKRTGAASVRALFVLLCAGMGFAAVARTQTLTMSEYTEYWYDELAGDNCGTNRYEYTLVWYEPAGAYPGYGTDWLMTEYGQCWNSTYGYTGFNELNWWIHEPAPILPGQISIAGQVLDCNGRVVVLVPGNGQQQNREVDVTPQVAGKEWYTFDVSILPQTQVNLTRSYHPLFSPAPTLASLQARFDEGEVILATDHDECVRDNDPRLLGDPRPSFYIADSVPVYVDFNISDANPVVFPSGYAAREYYEITDVQKVDQLARDNFAYVKMVLSLPQYGGGVVLGYGVPSPPGMVIPATAIADTLLHEWAHTRDLPHRGEFGNPNSGQPDTNALMYYEHPSGRELNRFEKSVLERTP